MARPAVGAPFRDTVKMFGFLLSLHILPFVVLAVLVLLLVLCAAGGAFVFIPNDSFGVVERKWSTRGSSTPSRSFMAVGKEPGFLPEILLGGWHVFPLFQYRVHRQKLITVRSIGYLFARTGSELENGQTLGRWPDGVDPGDTRGFLTRGGQRGAQRRILRQGTYAINTALFVVLTEEGAHGIAMGDKEKTDSLHTALTQRNGYDPVVIDGDRLAVVNVQDGPALDHEEIIAPSVGTDAKVPASFHNSFQDIEKFLAAGGRRGRQQQVLVEGTYFLNRLFATVELKDKTVVRIGHVGVVISYTGPEGEDLSGEDYKHGQLVGRNQRGVWKQPLQPGKYAINPYALQVKEVPTTNFQLRWIENSTDSHNFDANLSEIRLITSDAFEPILPLSVVVHIAQEDAPYVLQQFAEINRLVDQTLDPMVSAWFKDAAQSKTFLQLVSQRAELQRDALAAMKVRFEAYKLNVREVMVGTPKPAPGDKHIEQVLEQLRARQVAKEQAETFKSQQATAVEERTLREAEATASQQEALTASVVAIEIAENTGMAELKRKTRDAEVIRVTADAEAHRTTTAGQAEAGRITAIGAAEASAAAAQVHASGGADNALRKAVAQILSEAVQNAAQPLVPGVVMGQGGAATVPDLLMGLALAKGDLTRSLAGDGAAARADG